jgi:hypothetical protein
MIVKLGFNTDFGRDKFDIGLDETDLARILAENGLPPDALLTSREAFQVLYYEAERLCAARRSQLEDKDRWLAEMRRAGEQLAGVLGKITARLGLLTDEHE